MNAMAEKNQDVYVIRKDKAEVVAWTSQFRIEGKVHFIPRARISDLLNRQDIAFIPMTDVVLFDHLGKEVLRTDFLAVNKDQITVLSMSEEPQL